MGVCRQADRCCPSTTCRRASGPRTRSGGSRSTCIAGRGARAGRRERRRQVDADQDHDRPLPPDGGKRLRRRRRPWSCAARPTRRPRHRLHLPGADGLPRPQRRGEHLHGHRGGGRFVRWRDVHRRAGEILRQLEVDIDPRALASQLTRRCAAGGRDRQGDLARRPGADHGRADRLAVGARGAAPVPPGPPSHGAGVAVLFVSHRLDEVFEIADRITVFRDGRRISTNATGGGHRGRRSIRDMVGREIADFFDRTRHEPGDVALRVEGLGRRGAFEDVSFEVRAARCSGFAGLVGAGRTESARRCSASRRPTAAPSGAATWRSRSTARARRWTTASPTCPRTGASSACRCRSPSRPTSRCRAATVRVAFGLVDRDAERRDRRHATASAWTSARRRLSRRSATSRAATSRRSMLAKWLDVKPSVLVLDEPTRGIDVGAKAEVHRADRRARRRRDRGHRDLVRPPRGAGDERPRARDARGPPDGRSSRAPTSNRSGS